MSELVKVTKQLQVEFLKVKDGEVVAIAPFGAVVGTGKRAYRENPYAETEYSDGAQWAMAHNGEITTLGMSAGYAISPAMAGAITHYRIKGTSELLPLPTQVKRPASNTALPKGQFYGNLSKKFRITKTVTGVVTGQNRQLSISPRIDLTGTVPKIVLMVELANLTKAQKSTVLSAEDQAFLDA